MLAREPQSTLFETRQVQRDESCPSIELPLNCMVLKGGDWARKLEPDSRLTDVLIRDEYVVALRAIIDFFLGNETTEDAMEVDDIEPAPLAFDVPLGLVSKNRGFILLGDPGIGERSCFLSHHSDVIHQCRENCALICFTGSAPPSSASDHLSVTRHPSILFRRRWRLRDQSDAEAYRHKLHVSVPQIDMVFDRFKRRTR